MIECMMGISADTLVLIHSSSKVGAYQNGLHISLHFVA